MNRPDPELLQIFSAEQAEHVRRMRAVAERLADGSDRAAFEDLLRSAHTLKGASRAAGFEPTEMLTHALEGVFVRLRSGEAAWGPNWQPLLLRTLDAIEDILASVLAGRAAPDTGGLIREIDGALGIETRTAPDPGGVTIRSGSAAPAAEFVRINAAYLDELMSASSELVASAGADDSKAEAVTTAEAALREWSRLRQEAAPSLGKMRRDPQFNPVIECVDGAERELRRLAAEVRSDASERRQRGWGLRRLADRLDETAFRVRMVGADTVFGGFGPMLRNLAQEHQKHVEFRVEGLELPADRLVLQALKDPVMHLLRNALSHGIETQGERIAARKSPAGTIRLGIRTQGDRLHVTVEDDGRGLDRRALLEEAIRRGLAREDTELSDKQLADLIFLPGFSTSALTTLSGRGMGLSIVRHEVARLHGDIRVQSEAGKGTSVTVSVPLSISSQQVLLVEAGGHPLGILTSFVERLCRLRRDQMQTFEGKRAMLLDSQPVALARLDEVLNFPAAGETGHGPFPVVVIAAGERRAAVMVDRMIDVRDLVIKPTGLPSSKAGFSAGAVPLPDGTVAVILNIPEVLDRFRELRAARSESAAVEQPAKQVHSILVVDDSLTTRSLERSLLEAHGYKVHLAVDGIDALDTLRTEGIDLVITDIMMPRMDGFQLLEQIRRNKKTEKLPVIVVSSMESREDQERGLALGADAYIVKRKFDQRELLETVRQIL